MTNHMESAVEAACYAYRYPNRIVTNTSDGRLRYRMEAALEAALPHIRAMIAEEIREEKPPGYSTQQLEYGLALEDAAQIAEEKQP